MKIRTGKNMHKGNLFILPAINVIRNKMYVGRPADISLHFNWLIFHCWVVFDGIGIEYLPFLVVVDQPLISVRRDGRLPVRRFLFIYIRGKCMIVRLFSKGIRISF